jgi:hypothetical protein
VLREGLARGFTHGFTTAAVILAAGALLVGVVMNAGRPAR